LLRIILTISHGLWIAQKHSLAVMRMQPYKTALI